jgi:site-specific DNA recombinase
MSAAKSSSPKPPSLDNKKRVGIWIRVSTDDQAQGESPEHHERRAREYASFCDWKVIEVYDLAGVSGKTVMENPEAKRMMADVKRGHITGLIFSKLARLARNTKELLEFAEFFRQHNADMISLQERVDTSSPAGRLFYTIIAAMAQWEREETVSRVNASIAIRAKIGSALGGPAPFGYEWKDKRLVPHPKEAPVRKLMYDLYLKHKRKKTVTKLLTDAGHRSRRGSKFTLLTLTRLLQDPTAKGVHRINYTTRASPTSPWTIKPESEWKLHRIPAIVSEEVWNECNRLIEDSLSKQSRPTKKPVHIFAGVTFCHCGQKMHIPANTLKYTCRACRNKVAEDVLEEAFVAQIRDFALSPNAIEAYLKSSDQTAADKEQFLATQRESLQQTKREIQKTFDLYQKGKLDADGFAKFHDPLVERQKQIETSIPRLEAELDILKVNTLSDEEVSRNAQNLADHWAHKSQEEKLEMVEQITEKITVGEGELEIAFLYSPSGKDAAERERKGRDSNPRNLSVQRISRPPQ